MVSDSVDRRSTRWFNRWAYSPADGRRDLRLDLLRGFAVFAMVVDHFGGESFFTPITGSNRFLVSAAEGFVFLSGFVMGMVYGRRIERVGWTATTEAILRRAAVLYLVTTGLTLLFVGLFMFTTLRLWLDRAYGLGLTDPLELVVGTLTLHYTYHGTDILWMYTVLIAASPLFFHLLVTGRTAGLLAGSGLLWLVYQLFPQRAAIPWVVDNAVYFPVAAWQLYFVVGLAIGHHRDALARRLGGIPRWPAFALLTLAFVGLILLDWGHDTGRIATWPLLKGLAGETYARVFDKPSVAWGRIVAFAIAVGFFFLLVTQLWRPIHRLTGWLLLPLGQASLLAYGLHLIVIVAVYNLDLWGFYGRSRLADTFLQAVTVLIVWGLVQSWDRLGVLPRRLSALLDAPIQRPGWPRTAVVAAAGLLLVLSVSTTLLVGPVRAARPVSLAEGVQDAGTLVYEPEPTAPRVAPVVLVLHDQAATGPRTAAPLIDRARETGWLVVAPTLEQLEWATADDVRVAAADLLPRLRDLVDDLDEHVGQPTGQQILVYGQGRGGQLAHLFALFYPERVAALATVDALPCTLPLTSVGPPGGARPLEFPAGIADLADYRGEPMNVAALGRVSFWLQVPPDGSSGPGLDCSWLGQPVEPREQLERFARALTGVGAELHIVRTDRAGAEPWQRALRFLSDLAGP